MEILLTGATIIDGSGASPRINAAIRVTAGRIVAIGPASDFEGERRRGPRP